MRWFTRVSLRNPVVVVILALLIAAAGAFSASQLKEELMPNISFPVIAVVTAYPNASPNEVADSVTTPLENALRGMANVQTVTSTSTEGVSEVAVEFNLGQDLNAAEQKIQQTVSGVTLPSGAMTPTIHQFSFDSGPIMQVALASSNVSARALRNLANDTVVPSLEGVAGVSSVQTSGALSDNVTIDFQSSDLRKYGLTETAVVSDLQAANVSSPLGAAIVDNTSHPVQLIGQFDSLRALRSFPIPIPSAASTAGQSQLGSVAFGKLGRSAASSPKLPTIPLSDVANVSLTAPANMAISRTNGKPSVYLGIVKSEDANTVSVASDVRKELTSLQSELPSGVRLITLYDSSTMITASVNGLIREGLLGALFAALVILLFLRNWRTTIIAVISIPLSLLTAMIFLREFNVTLNIMTLGGMAVATGRVVDDSIVVIENIFRSWRQGIGFGKRLVLHATGEVGHAITSSTITTVAVFLPLGLVSGVVGKIFMPFALTVICSLLSSLLVALTVVPFLAWVFIARRPVDPSVIDIATLQASPDGYVAEDGVRVTTGPSHKRRYNAAQRGYRKTLLWSLTHKKTVLLLTILVFLSSLYILRYAGSTFIPESTEKYATIQISMPVGTPETATLAKTTQIDKIVKSFGSDVLLTDTTVGSDPGQIDTSGGVSGANQASMFLQLSSTLDVNTFVTRLQDKLEPIQDGATIHVKELKFGGGSGSFTVDVDGSNYQEVSKAAAKVTHAVAEVPGLTNVSNNLKASELQVSVVPDAARAASHGLSAYQISNTVRAYLDGSNIGSMKLNGNSYTILATIDAKNQPSTLSDIRNLSLATPTGQQVTLGDVASVSLQPTPIQVLHQDGQPYAEISADYTSNNTGKPSKAALTKIQSLNLPADVHVKVSGDAQQQNQSFTELIEAILVAVGMVYIVMLISFGEWSAPFAILFSMPVALIGGFYGTVIGGQPISVSSLIGILMLMGIVVTNAIVFVDRVEQQRKKGMSIRAALVDAGLTRLRPILMTAIATICALLPLALGYAEGALISQGLAVIVIGGLVTSTLLTLVIVPLMYEVLHFRKLRQERSAAAANR